MDSCWSARTVARSLRKKIIMVRDLAGEAHWDKRDGAVRPRFPSKLNASVGDLLALLEPYATPGARVLEIGCAPGKFLLWCAVAKQSHAYGVEYADNSHKKMVQLFADANVAADIRKEDFMQTTLDHGSFDLVYSFGVIEHFDDPGPMIDQHYAMLKPGGRAVITVPHFGAGSIYGWLSQRMNRENYDIHNASIMSERKLLSFAPEGSEAKAYRYGRLSPWALPWQESPIAKLTCYGLAAAALLQPFQIKSLSPWLVLELKRPLTLKPLR